MHRFFVVPEALAGDRFPLPVKIAHQVTRVLRLRDGDEVLLLDLWGRLPTAGSVFADITWVGFTGAQVPDEHREVFAAAVGGRDAAIALVQEAARQGRELRGWEVDRAARSGLLKSDFMLTSASGLHATPIGEYVLCVMLMFCKGAPRFVRAQERREWLRFMPQELYGKTVGVVGLGHIGAEVARLAKAFGCRVLATRRSVTSRTKGELVDELLPPPELPALLAESDFVVLAVPLTPDTRHLIGEAELRAMRPTGVLINIARGAVLDEAALVRALKEGWIAGAGLDVFEQEPLPPESELWDMENVILSPHISGGTEIYNQRAVGIFCENLRRYLAGERLMNLADPSRGY